jgi:murein DD-endopeptidase MepM/ murein hydrolase activator NlpD
MARKFYTCIIVPDASQRLHKLRIPVKALYLLSAIGAVSFFVAVALGFNYISMASRVGDYTRMEAENTQLRIDTKQLKISTSQLKFKISELENQALKITQMFENDAMFRRLGKLVPTAGGSRENVSTADLVGAGAAEDTLESMQNRMVDLENQLSVLDKKTEVIRTVPTIWPLKGRIGSHYGRRLDPFTGDAEVHAGIDIVAPMGTAIEAPADGRVIFAQRKSDYGNLIVLQHAHGITTRYGHLSKYNVRSGQTVQRGDIIGWVGLTGRTTAPHLHYEVRLHDRPENPSRYLR